MESKAIMEALMEKMEATKINMEDLEEDIEEAAEVEIVETI